MVLDAADRRALLVEVADDVGGQPAAGINAAVDALGRDAADVQVGDPVEGRLVDGFAELDPAVLGLAVHLAVAFVVLRLDRAHGGRERLLNGGDGQPEQPGELRVLGLFLGGLAGVLGGILLDLQVFIQRPRIHRDGDFRAAGREEIAVRVEDGAAPGVLDHDLAAGPVHKAEQFLAVHNLQEHQPHAHAHETGDDTQGQQRHPVVGKTLRHGISGGTRSRRGRKAHCGPWRTPRRRGMSPCCALTPGAARPNRRRGPPAFPAGRRARGA